MQDTSPGKGVTLLDLIFGNTIFVHDVSMSTRLVRWDGVLTRVVPGERGLELTGIGMVVAPHNLDTLREWMEQDREESGVEWRAYLKGNWPRIRQQAYAVTSDAVRHLRLANTDGEELLISKSVYKVSDGNAVRDALRSRPEMDEDPAGGRFVWLNEKKTILGNIKVTDDELMFEANSRQRLDRGNQLLIDIAGAWIQHVRDEFMTQKELKRQAMESAGKPSAPSTIPREVQQEFMERYLADHYGKWPDEPLPALGGKTPREAVKTEKGRLQVADVLKSIENSEERKRLEGDPFYDIGPLRRALGIE